jgi:protease-4
MVDIAGSAGYSVSYRARTIVAGANTITGSIGSITGKLNLRGLYDRLGITKDGVGVGPGQGFNSHYRAWTPEDMEKVRERHWAEYHAWIADIASHRNMAKSEVDSLARGRVWTGAQAAENGLVDEVGGLDRAVALAKAAAELDADEEVSLVHYPQPEGFLSELLGMPMEAAAERAAMNWVRGRAAEAGRFSRSELRLLEVPIP